MQILRTNNFRGGLLVPSLNLDFMRGVLPSSVIFSRASAGTYYDANGVLQTAALNVPRFDYDPITKQPLGLLIEEQRTNLVIRSEEFDVAGWSKSNTSLNVNVAIAPNGTLTAEKLIDTTTNAEHSLSYGRTGTNETLTFSIYAKAVERPHVVLQFSNRSNAAVNARFDLTTGTLFNVSAANADYTNISTSIVPVGNGWYRCVLTTTKGSVNTVNSPGIFTVGNGSQTYAGDGISGIYIWGAQLEAGSFATSYIPTTTAAVTRSADVCSMSVGSWYNQNEGTLVLNALKAVPQGVVSRYYNLLPAGANNPQWYLANDASLNRVTMTLADESGSTLFSGTSPNTLTTSSIIRTAAAIRAGDCAFAVNSAVVGVGSPNVIPTFATLILGNNSLGGQRALNGYLRKFTYYPRRLPNSTLQLLTQ